MFKLYGELQAQESTMLKDCANLARPLALMAQTPHVKNPQYPYTAESSYQHSYDFPSQSYEADVELDDEEEFQNAIALVS